MEIRRVEEATDISEAQYLKIQMSCSLNLKLLVLAAEPHESRCHGCMICIELMIYVMYEGGHTGKILPRNWMYTNRSGRSEKTGCILITFFSL